MSRWKTLTGAVAFSAMGLVAAGAVAGGPRGGSRGPGHPGPGRMLEDIGLLGLSDEQRTAVQELMRQNHEAARPLMEQERNLHRQLREAASADGADPAKVGRIAIEEYRVGEQLHAQRKQLEESFVGLLTPEQKDMWTKIQAAHEKERERHKDGRGFGHGPRGPQGGPEGAVRQ